MAAFGTWSEMAVLNLLLLGSTSSAPAAWGLALGSAVPTASSVITTWEIGTGSGYTAQTCVMPACVLGSNTVTNTVAMTFGPFSVVAVRFRRADEERGSDRRHQPDVGLPGDGGDADPWRVADLCRRVAGLQRRLMGAVRWGTAGPASHGWEA